METILCRISYCETCFKNGNPKPKLKFIVFGSDSQKFKLKLSEGYGVKGFSPHILRLLKVIGENIVYSSSCSICNTQHLGDDNYGIDKDTYERGIIDIRSWNAWVSFTDDFDYRI